MFNFTKIEIKHFINMKQRCCVYNSPLGWLEFKTETDKLVALHFVDQPETKDHSLTPFENEIVKQLNAYFDKKKYHFNFPLAIEGTRFQKKIWEILTQIPKGSTASYLKVAQQYGNPQAVRAVARAIGKNPLLVIIPCHRVIGSDGSLIGYSGGISKKKALLAHEGYLR